MISSPRKIRVLVVDDSAVARTFLINGLAAFPRIEVVGYAINALDAKAKILRLNPDVMTLDVEMPGISGIDFLGQLLPEHPLPVILVSSLNLRVFDALAAGAVDFVRKPDGTESRDSFFRSLSQKIVVASCAKVVPGPPPHPADHHGGPRRSGPQQQRCGSGPDHHRSGGLHRRYRGHAGRAQASARRHSRHGHRPGICPPASPPLYAQRLNKLCAMEVREAKKRRSDPPGPGSGGSRRSAGQGGTHGKPL